MSTNHRSVYQQASRISEIISLFQSVFGTGIAPELLSRELLEWKFFQDHPGWEGSRSFCFYHDGAPVAHACAWPIALHTDAGEVRAIHILDWMARPCAVGSGVAIFRDVMELADVTIAIGGSDAARKLLPKLGFRRYGDFRCFARVVRPLSQYRARPKHSAVREICRLARNSSWALDPLPKVPSGWSAQPRPRSSSRINYLLNCPVAHCHLYSVTDREEARGYFILNEVHRQTRIIELVLHSSDKTDWEAAFSLALRTAAQFPRTCEIVAASSLPWLDAVLRRCGMREREVRPVHVYDARGLLANAPLHLQMTDSDAFFLYNPSYPFLT